MTRNFPYVLVGISMLLVVWATLGFVEYFEPSLAFELQDTNFPRGTQFLHWLLILLTGAIFAVGFFLRWRHTRFVTIAMYAALATLCFVETVDFQAFGGGPNRFFAMAAEYAGYIGFSTYLLRSREIEKRFGRTS